MLNLDIEVDGSALKNPGHSGGIAAVVSYSDGRPSKKIFESYEKTTNNRMELRAAIKSIEYTRAISKKERIGSVTIRSDSKYFYNGYKSVPYWSKNKWIGASQQILKNIDLWKRILSLRTWNSFQIIIEWNKGKTTEENKNVDKLAKCAAKTPTTKKDFGYSKWKVTRSKVLSKNSPSLFPALGQKEKAHIYAYCHEISKEREEYEIKFDLYSPIERSYVEKHVAFVDAKKTKEFHLGHYYIFVFNNDQKHPLILKMRELKNSPKCINTR